MDRGSQNFSLSGVTDFKNFMSTTQVTEIPASNGFFTWFRGQAKSKLDRLLVNPEWISLLPSLQVTLLKRGVSDHCPLLASANVTNWGPKPFKFHDVWLSHPGCLKLITDTWNSKEGLTVNEKFKQVRQHLKQWNVAAVFGHIDQCITSAEEEIQKYDLISNERLLSEEELTARREAQQNLWQWLKRKETFWAQNSRAKWLKDGDKNTKYFHILASIRKRKNSLNSVFSNGKLIIDPAGIHKEAVSYFKGIFKESHRSRPTIEGLSFRKLSADQIKNLISPFRQEEIDMAVQACNSQKSPGPDGFNFRFIKEAWEVIKGDIYKIFDDFWISGKLPRGSNVAYIALIAKMEAPKEFKDFRPISMVGCIYKMIAKVLSSRLQKVMDSLIGPFQSSFIKGRQILDGALIAGELIESCRRKKVKAAILKLDFHKAFDSVAWSFLEWILIQMGFPSLWISWILACVKSAEASILINGSPTVPFKLHRGLRQGDPLSPFLFDLVVEPLSLLIQKATSLDLWEGISVGNGGNNLTHLQYADDTIVFCSPNIESLLNIKRALILFQLASGLQVNFHKSSLMGINVDDVWLKMAAESLLCKVGQIPFSYLGLPIGSNANRMTTWAPIIKRIEGRLATWKCRNLSIAGRLTLIKASLSSLPIYYMSLFPAPKGIIEKINKLQRQFLWNGGHNTRSPALASWSLVELPKILGGLSGGNILHRNLALLFKWVWRYLNEPAALWRTVVQSKYRYTPLFQAHELSSPPHGGPWRLICNHILNNTLTNKLLKSSIKRSVGNGLKAHFWHDKWAGEVALKAKFPRLFSISSGPDAFIHEFGRWEGSFWRWNFIWTRNLRPRDKEELADLFSLLNETHLSLDGDDSFIWKPQKSGDFSVKSLTMELAKFSAPCTPCILHPKKLWAGLIPPRIEIFTWLALLNKINTRGKLLKLKIIAESEALCPLC